GPARGRPPSVPGPGRSRAGTRPTPARRRREHRSHDRRPSPPPTRQGRDLRSNPLRCAWNGYLARLVTHGPDVLLPILAARRTSSVGPPLAGLSAPPLAGLPGPPGPPPTSPAREWVVGWPPRPPEAPPRQGSSR